MISNTSNFKEIELYYERKLSIVKIASIMSRISHVIHRKLSREEKRNGNLLSLWIKRYFNLIQPYLSEFRFFFNDGNVPQEMYCIYKGSPQNNIGIYETPHFHQLYLQELQKPPLNRVAILNIPTLPKDIFSIHFLLNH